MNLHVLVYDDVEHFAAGDLQDRGLDGELLECGEHRTALVRPVARPVKEPRRAVQHRFDRVLEHHHLRQLVAHGTERGDRLAELLAPGSVPR